MGDGGARDVAVGFSAVRVARGIGALAVLGVLAACSESNVAVNSAGPLSGAAVGLGLGGITANPLIGYAAGIGTQAAVTALQKYLSRKLHQGEQDNIAAAVGRLGVGESAAWRIHYAIPIGNEHGDVTVTRVMSSPLTTCKEVVFTIITSSKPGAPRPVYVTSACRDSDGMWKWAEAEAAVARWGFLQ